MPDGTGAEAPELPENSSFSKTIRALQISWDSTSYGALDKCPRFYQYSIIEGWTPAGAINAHLNFGLVLHSATELYSRVRAAGGTHDQGVIAALRHALEATWDPILRRPWASEEPTKTRNTLLRTIVWYLDRFQNDSLETLILANGAPAVELSFRFQADLEAPTGEPYIICGHLDRVVRWNDELWITDRKTTKFDLDDGYFRNYNPSNQMETYAVAGMITLNAEIKGLIIDGIQVLVGSSRFHRQPIEFPHANLEEFLQDFQIHIHEAESYALANYWPKRRSSCGFGRMSCQFRGVCSADPAIRPRLLETHFVRRVWDPLEPR